MVQLSNQMTSLKHLLIVNEHLAVYLRFMRILFVLAIYDSLKLSDFNLILISHPCDLSQLRILQHCIRLTKEIVNQHRKIVSWSDSARLFPILLYQGVDLWWKRIIIQVIRVLLAKRRPISRQERVL